MWEEVWERSCGRRCGEVMWEEVWGERSWEVMWEEVWGDVMGDVGKGHVGGGVEVICAFPSASEPS